MFLDPSDQFHQIPTPRIWLWLIVRLAEPSNQSPIIWTGKTGFIHLIRNPLKAFHSLCCISYYPWQLHDPLIYQGDPCCWIKSGSSSARLNQVLGALLCKGKATLLRIKSSFVRGSSRTPASCCLPYDEGINPDKNIWSRPFFSIQWALHRRPLDFVPCTLCH